MQRRERARGACSRQNFTALNPWEPECKSIDSFHPHPTRHHATPTIFHRRRRRRRRRRSRRRRSRSRRRRRRATFSRSHPLPPRPLIALSRPFWSIEKDRKMQERRDQQRVANLKKENR